ncbi:MAG: cupin domain-containing protein [Chloroflexi bacterium]|nr:cupin domain-containing protein [Chloroflexota bacterium]
MIRLGAQLEPSSSPTFDGRVLVQQLVGKDDADVCRVRLVRFVAGARTRWHVHTFDQVLLATEGVGVVADQREEHALRAGELAVVRAGTVHWHGAAPEGDFAHISISTDGETRVLGPHGS